MFKLLLVILVLTYLLHKYLTKNFDYWKKRNVPYPKPLPLFGNYYEVFTFRISIGNYIRKLYDEFDVPYFGIFSLRKPYLVVKCPELIKAILIKDFDNFCDRAILCNEDYDPISGNMLFFVNNPRWRVLRLKTAPAFSNLRIKGMFYLISEASKNLNSYIQTHYQKRSLDAKELCAKYTTDVIASCAFGIRARSFEDENADFRKVGREMFKLNLLSAVRQFCYIMMPSIVELFRFTFFKKSVYDFFRKAFWETVEYRKKTNTKRNDLVDILMQITEESDISLDFTGDRVVAQAVVYFGGGFEGTSTTFSFTLYELSLSLDIQNKVRAEVKSVLKKYEQLTYEAIQDLKYLDQVICETLRKHPIVPYLDRICLNNYKLPNSDLIVEKGTPIMIPVYGLHHDAQIFPDPELFNPGRFADKTNVFKYAYLPFGGGPRICAGKNFAIVAIKLGIASILLEYEVYRCFNTPVPLIYEKKTFLTLPADLPIGFRKISEKN